MLSETIEGGLRVRASAKLNLYLEVGGRRPDGYHDIDSIFQEVSLHDELELFPTRDGRVVLEEEGICEAEKNLVHRAASRFRQRFLPAGSPLGVRVRLRKGIPQGAGLGGGSSDAAATIVAVARLWGVRPDRDEVVRLAAELGSDVPFFLVGGTARCRGRGEVVESWSAAFDGEDPFHYVLAYPRINVSTKGVYEALDAARGPDCALTPPSPLDSMRPVDARDLLRGGRLLFNRFEEVVYRQFPELRKIHATLGGEPFVKVLMSGSGSTVYGLCRDAREAEDLATALRGRVEADIYAVSSERAHGFWRDCGGRRDDAPGGGGSPPATPRGGAGAQGEVSASPGKQHRKEHRPWK